MLAQNDTTEISFKSNRKANFLQSKVKKGNDRVLTPMKPDLGAAALSYPTGVRGLSASGILIPVRNEYYNLAPGSGACARGEKPGAL